MKHLMIDLETLGTSADSVFLSIAAVQFDPKGGVGQDFSINIQLESALQAGRIVQSGTIQWWLTQRPEIMKKMFDSPSPLVNALEALKRFCALQGVTHPWGNSASFDLGMLVNAYTKAGIALPWLPWNERCYRTAFALSGLTKSPKSEDAHDPLVDCRYQISELQRVYKHLNLKQ